MVAAGRKVLHQVAEEVMELQENQGLGFRDECKENQEGSRSAAPSGLQGLAAPGLEGRAPGDPAPHPSAP